MSLALAGMALAVTPAAARQPAPVEDQLISELEAFTLQPSTRDDVEINGSFDASPVVASLGGTLAEGTPPVDGHIRTFTSDEYPGNTVRVMGVDVTEQDPARLMAGFAGWEDWQDGPMQVFVDADPPLDGLVSYSTWVNRPADQVRTEVTAYVADDLLVVIEFEGHIDSTATLRRTAKAQVALAPATATPGYTPTPVEPTDPSTADEPGEATEEEQVVATGQEPRSGMIAAGGGSGTVPLLALGAAVVVIVVGLAARGGANRKRVRRGPQP